MNAPVHFAAFVRYYLSVRFDRFLYSGWIGVVTFVVSLLFQALSLTAEPEPVLKDSPRSDLKASTSSAEDRTETGFKFAGVNDDQEVIQFWDSFQNAVAANDKESVAEMAHYPFNVNYSDDAIEKNYRKIRTKTALVQSFDRIFDTALKDFIAKTSAVDLMGNYHGIRTPRGEIWIGVFCTDNQNDCSGGYEIKLRTIHANSAFIAR